MKTMTLFSFLIISSLYSQAQQLAATEELALLHIQLADMDDRPRPNEKLEIQAQKTNQRYPVLTDKEGKFNILLPEGDQYSVRVMGWGSEREFSRFELEQAAGVFEATLTLNYEPARAFTLENLQFETAKAHIKTESYPILDGLAEFLGRKSNVIIRIEGHTDNVGEDAANQILSENRAKAVVDYLVKKGISKSRLQSQGFGESQPIASNDSPEGRQLNRRTEAVIVSE